MPIVALILLFLVSTAQAVVPFRLVTEIQLPARTIQWDVQHYEDSTSFGWVALTEGAPILGYDEEINDDTITVSARDTFWFKSNLDAELDYLTFSREGFNYLENPLGWAKLTLLKWPDYENPIAVAKAKHYYDQINLYFLDLSGDSILAIRNIYAPPPWGTEAVYTFKNLSTWPALPSSTNWIIVSANIYNDNYSGDEGISENHSAGQLINIPSLTYVGFGSFSHQVFHHSSTFTFAFRAGRDDIHYGCDDCPHYWIDNRVGVGHYSDSLATTVIETFHSSQIKEYGQEDFDGTQRVFATTGDCYNAATGEIVFNNTAIAGTILTAYVRNAPGEDFLVFSGGRFQIYDGRTGEWVDSTSVIQGIPQYTLVTDGFDQLVTYDAALKLVRMYQSLSTLLTINVTDAGQVQLSWMPSAGAVGYRLDSSSNSDFNGVYSDFYSAATTSVTVSPNAPIKFFRVTPLFE